MRVNQYAVRRNARPSQLSQSVVLLKYQIHRRDLRRERVAIRGRSGTSRCSDWARDWVQSLWWRVERRGRFSVLSSVPLVGFGLVTLVVGR